MAQQVKGLATKDEELNSILRTYLWRKVGNNHCKLSYDLHTHAVVCTQVCTEDKGKKEGRRNERISKWANKWTSFSLTALSTSCRSGKVYASYSTFFPGNTSNWLARKRTLDPLGKLCVNRSFCMLFTDWNSTRHKVDVQIFIQHLHESDWIMDTAYKSSCPLRLKVMRNYQDKLTKWYLQETLE